MEYTSKIKSPCRAVRFITACLFLIPILASIVQAEEIVIISNKNATETALSKEDVKQIFLGRKTRWSDNKKINFVTLKSGDVHKNFLKTYVRKTPSQFRTFWKKMIFTGKGRAPKSFATPEEMLTFVSETPGAIGYIPAGAMNDTVKKISVN